MNIDNPSNPPPFPTPATPPMRAARRHPTAVKLLIIAAVVVVLQVPLYLVNMLRQERMTYREPATKITGTGARMREALGISPPAAAPVSALPPASPAAEGYRMVERALKHGVLVLALVFAAFFLFEILAGMRLHVVHYSLVGAALCLFYLALLALGEVAAPGVAYVVAAVASSLLIVLYSAAILRSRARAGIIAGLLTLVYGALYVVLRMEDFALLAGTAALFAALGAVMYFTRNIDWSARDGGTEPAR